MPAALLSVTACAVGPDYHEPSAPTPESFKEGIEWQRAAPNPEGAVSSTWWLEFEDDALSRLVDQALAANQSIAAAEANYRLAQATIAANAAGFYPTLSAGLSSTRSDYGAASAQGAGTLPGAQTLVTANVSAGWEPDLWGSIRRSVESSRDSAQATDAELAGVRLSVAASVATDYSKISADQRTVAAGRNGSRTAIGE